MNLPEKELGKNIRGRGGKVGGEKQPLRPGWLEHGKQGKQGYKRDLDR